MAYIIHINDDIYKIASNDTERDEVSAAIPPYVATEISDSDFSKIKNNTAVVSISGGTVSITDLDESSIIFQDEDELKQYIETLKPLMQSFIQKDNESKSLYSTINSYLTTLNTHDYSSITYPLNNTWEKYCEDNSIDYINTLQIP
tara:strand:- start:3311 stop:3748 length:438 start_codon:yes stop_codon:yes gene_type:complete